MTDLVTYYVLFAAVAANVLAVFYAADRLSGSFNTPAAGEFAAQGA